jgi:phosphate transporter
MQSDSVADSSELETSIWLSKSNYAFDVQLIFKRRITNLYIQFTSLRSFVELNYSGFRKILKKYGSLGYLTILT